MKMKSILFIACIFSCSFVVAQNKIIGKWKPAFLAIDKLLSVDIKADTVYLSDSLDVVFKDDKEPEGSKEMMKMLGGIMLEKMKVIEQEFLASGAYIEKNTKRNTTIEGTYTFDAATHILVMKSGNKIQQFTVSFKNGRLLLTGEMDSAKGKKGSMLVEYEHL
jgi:hypothetical protein